MSEWESEHARLFYSRPTLVAISAVCDLMAPPAQSMQRFFFVSFLLVLRLSAILTVVIRLITTRTMLVLRRRVAQTRGWLSAAASADIAVEFNTSYTG